MPSVILRTSDREVCRIDCGSSLQSFAMRWNYVVRQRQRWLDDPAARDRQVERLIDELRRIGIYARHLRRLRGIVEVGIPVSSSDRFWEARVLPWEYVLASATGPYRGKDSILVVRHLKTGRRRRTRQPKSYAVVETAPGELAGQIDFSAERKLVTAGSRVCRRIPSRS